MAHLSALLLLPLLAASVSACCDTLRLDSGGMGDFYQGSRLGHYVLSGSSSSGKSIYTQTNGDNYMFYLPGPGQIEHVVVAVGLSVDTLARAGAPREDIVTKSTTLIEVSHPPGVQPEGVTAGADRGSEEREKQQC